MVVLVTGAARGIGRAVTARCLAADMKVVAVDQNEDALARLAQEVPAGSGMVVLVGDVARQETAEAAVARALESFGRLDGIVSNAGIFQAAPLSETTLDQWRRVLDVASFYDPAINRSYLEFARHYGIGVVPARVRKPRDKPLAENAVQQVERWVLAPLRNRVIFPRKSGSPSTCVVITLREEVAGEGGRAWRGRTWIVSAVSAL